MISLDFASPIFAETTLKLSFQYFFNKICMDIDDGIHFINAVLERKLERVPRLVSDHLNKSQD